MRKILIISLLTMSSVYAQTHLGGEAQKIIKGSSEVHFSKESSTSPAYIKLNSEVSLKSITSWAKKVFKLDEQYTLKSTQITSDKLGYSHYKYQQYYQGVPVEGNVLIVHAKNGHIQSLNGHIINDLGNINTAATITEQQAFQNALDKVNAVKYRWEDKDEVAYLNKTIGKNSSAIPKGEKVIIETKAGSKKYRLVYKFDIYAVEPIYRGYVYVDASTGVVIKEIDRICHKGGIAHVHDDHHGDEKSKISNNQKTQADVTGTANTRYSGTQTITTESFTGGFRLRESGRNIETYDMNNGTSYLSAVDFVSDDNIWNETANYDDAAYDAHWGAEITYDYYLNEHGRDSYDNAGATMLSYIHYNTDYDNAFWDGQRMTYGDGSHEAGGFTPLTALDVVGHEFTHGVTEYTADLIYQGESGALNEAFSDIFGTAIEFAGKPGTANYEMGDDIDFDGGALRNMSNPNQYQNPDTYQGDFWDAFEEVHTNSGVGGFWFYLLAEGGTGTNDNSDNFTVSGIGISKAADVAYRTLSVYLTPTSDYADARFYSIKAAIDLYGPCTAEVEAVTNAWYAVGVGSVYSPTVTADFVADTLYCSEPATVVFTNLSSNAGSFIWDFGDASGTNTDVNPTHTFTNFGNYTITLQADGGACGTDSEIKTNYINLSSTATCVTLIPATGTGQKKTTCDGLLYDDGGASMDYSDNSDGSITIEPTGATAVVLDFTSFDFEEDFDYLLIYDGPSTSSPSLGAYTGHSLPEGGNLIYSTGGQSLYSNIQIRL